MPLGGNYRSDEQSRSDKRTGHGLATRSAIAIPATTPVMVAEGQIDFSSGTPLGGPDLPMGMGANEQYPDMAQADAELMQQTAEREGPAVDEAELNALEENLVRVLEDGTAAAYSLSEKTKEKWDAYRALMLGDNPIDDPDDPLTQLGVYAPLIAKLLDVWIAQETLKLIPDPAAMDFFMLVARLPGSETISEALSAQLRQKFKAMAPEGANGFLTLFSAMLYERAALGNTLALMTHEVLSEPDDGDGLIEGPAVQRLDPANVWPWRVDVDTFAQTAATIYDPIAPDQIEEFGFHNIDLIYNRESPEPLSMRDEQARSFTGTDDDATRTAQPTMTMLPRKIYVGFFPWHMLHAGAKDGSKRCTPEYKAQVLMALASKYGKTPDGVPVWSPEQIHSKTWWMIEWVGKTLAAVRPYPLDLPMGKAPIVQDKFFPVPGHIWGLGLYDRCAQDERLYNSFLRDLLSLSKFIATPPAEGFKDLLDPEWLQLHGDQPRFAPGDIVWRRSGIPGEMDKPAIRPIEYNERALQHIQNVMAMLSGQMQTLTGVTQQMQGMDSGGTATQNANNVSQSMSLAEAKCKLTEHGLLREIVERCYVIMSQAMRELGVPQMVTLSDTMQGLYELEIKPEDVISFALIDIVMTGVSSVSNLQQQRAGFGEFLSTWLPQGGLDLMESMKLHAKLLKLSGSESIMVTQVPEQLMQWFAGALAAYGPQGAMAYMRMLPPAIQQQMAGFVMGQGGGMGAPGGAPGQPAPNQGGAQPPQDPAAMGQPGVDGAPPMMGAGAYPQTAL